MSTADTPAWLAHLDAGDLQLLQRFVLASGSMKDLAAEYAVSYPTIRQRMDVLIEKVRVLDSHQDDDALEAKLRLMVTSGELQPAIGKELMRLHRKTKGEKK